MDSWPVITITLLIIAGGALFSVLRARARLSRESAPPGMLPARRTSHTTGAHNAGGSHAGSLSTHESGPSTFETAGGPFGDTSSGASAGGSWDGSGGSDSSSSSGGDSGGGDFGGGGGGGGWS